MQSTVLNRIFGVLSLAIFFMVSSAAAPRASDEQIAIIGSLYKAFAWQALSNSNDIFGAPVAQQEGAVLRRYFDQELASLLVKDHQCATASGALCNLDFDPIFASQDPAAADLSIRSAQNNSVVVEFTYPPSGEKVRLEYRLARSQAGWRIVDIRYPGMSGASLKQLLAQLPRGDN